MIETWKNDFMEFVNSLNLDRDDYKTMMEYIDEIPAVQPDHVADISKKVADEDCISRRAAIDDMKDALDPHIVQFVKAKMAIEALPSVQPEPHWIPCSDRLPDVGSGIIFCDIDGDIFVGHRASDHWWSVDDKVKNVVAWMPLPEAYQKEGDT